MDKQDYRMNLNNAALDYLSKHGIPDEHDWVFGPSAPSIDVQDVQTGMMVMTYGSWMVGTSFSDDSHKVLDTPGTAVGVIRFLATVLYNACVPHNPATVGGTEKGQYEARVDEVCKAFAALDGYCDLKVAELREAFATAYKYRMLTKADLLHLGKANLLAAAKGVSLAMWSLHSYTLNQCFVPVSEPIWKEGEIVSVRQESHASLIIPESNRVWPGSYDDIVVPIDTQVTAFVNHVNTLFASHADPTSPEEAQRLLLEAAHSVLSATGDPDSKNTALRPLPTRLRAYYTAVCAVKTAEQLGFDFGDFTSTPTVKLIVKSKPSTVGGNQDARHFNSLRDVLNVGSKVSAPLCLYDITTNDLKVKNEELKSELASLLAHKDGSD